MKTWTMPRIDVEAFAANEHVAACEGLGLQCESHINAVEGRIIKQYIYDAASSIGGPQNSHPTITGGSHGIGERCTVTLNIQDFTFSNNTTYYFDANGNRVENNTAPANGYAVFRHKTSTPGYYVYCFQRMTSSGYPSSDGWHFVGGGANPTS